MDDAFQLLNLDLGTAGSGPSLIAWCQATSLLAVAMDQLHGDGQHVVRVAVIDPHCPQQHTVLEVPLNGGRGSAGYAL